jgi:hypothetical protein
MRWAGAFVARSGLSFEYEMLSPTTHLLTLADYTILGGAGK